VLHILVFRQGTMATSKEYRGRHEIIAQMLQDVSNSGSEGITKTMIMYRSSLSYFQLKEYLLILVENGLVEKFPQRFHNSSNSNEKFLYKITEKGIRFMHISNEIGNLMGVKWEHKDTTIRPDAISKL
jgi:predicted transcriptional regulator